MLMGKTSHNVVTAALSNYTSRHVSYDETVKTGVFTKYKAILWCSANIQSDMYQRNHIEYPKGSAG